MEKKVVIHCVNLGISNYSETLEIQERYFQGIINQKIFNRKNPKKYLTTKNYLLFVEHPSVYTLGKSGKIENLLINKAQLQEKNVSFFKTNRGGDITYHGPGQIVVYPILDLDNFFTDIHKYLRLIEECIIQTLLDFNIKAKRSTGQTGVWTNNKKNESKKICAIGIKTSRWVTMHGFALNVNTDLSFFENIIPCGIIGKEVTSIKNELRKEIDMNLVIDSIKNNFSTQFNAKII